MRRYLTNAPGESQNLSAFRHALNALEVLSALNVPADADTDDGRSRKRLAQYGLNDVGEEAHDLSCKWRRLTALSSGC